MFYHEMRVGNFVLRIAVPYQSVTDAKAYAVRGLLAVIGIGALVVLVLIFFMRSCDPRLIESAVSNLVQNAIRHSGTKTVEILLASRPDGKAEILVVDYGVGIPSDCLARIFERFYRVDKDRSRALGGTGLGLAIVKHIVQLHGGEVSVESRLGEGSTFKLVF